MAASRSAAPGRSRPLSGLRPLLRVGVSSGIGGERVAGIHGGRHRNGFQTHLVWHFQEGGKMGLLGVHSAVRNQTEQMQTPTAGLSMFHGSEQGWIGKELSVLN